MPNDHQPTIYQGDEHDQPVATDHPPEPSEVEPEAGSLTEELANPCAGPWRTAFALDKMFEQINAACPGRNKASDGTIGDTRHCAGNSDHNPWFRKGGIGVVTAMDITHDPAQGADMHALAAALVTSRDSRIKYIIWNRRILSATQTPWQWRPYTGSNPHTAHLHLSVNTSNCDDTRPWPAFGGEEDVIRKGDRGNHVVVLQWHMNELLNGRHDHPRGIKPDGVFGDHTEAAVLALQRRWGYNDTGVADLAFMYRLQEDRRKANF